jgi:hypothetical protein
MLSLNVEAVPDLTPAAFAHDPNSTLLDADLFMPFKGGTVCRPNDEILSGGKIS